MPSILVGALNIVLAEHTPEVYARLMILAGNLQTQVPYYGQRVAKLGKSFRTNNENLIVSSLNTYVKLDENEPWFDENINDGVEDQDYVRGLIPAGLHPSFRRSNVLMDTSSHRIVYEAANSYGHKFSPREVTKAFNLIFSSSQIVDEFGIVEVTSEPTDDAVERIFRLNHLSRLRIRLSRPNPDDHEDDEAFYERKLADNNARAMETILVKEKDAERLSPDEEIRRMAKVAARNGFVEGKGLDSQGYSVVETTRSHPRLVRVPIGDDLSISPLEGLFKALPEWKR